MAGYVNKFQDAVINWMANTCMLVKKFQTLLTLCNNHKEMA